MLALLLHILPLAVCWQDAGEPARGALLVAGVHDARRSIRSGTFAFVFTQYCRDGFGPRGHEIETEFSIVLAGGRVRVTRRDSLPSILLYKLPPELKDNPGDTLDPDVADRLRAMGTRGQEIAEDRFRGGVVAARTREVYYDVLGKPVPAPSSQQQPT